MSKKTARLTAAHATALCTSLVLTCVGLGAVTAPSAAAAPSTPCAAGAPLASDFDGDGTAELVAGGQRYDGSVYRGQQHVQTRTGDAGRWLTDTDGVRTADLNGDSCADAILFAGGHTPWLRVALGTPTGLDLSSAVEVTIPQAADVADDVRRSLVFEAAGLRHHGISQIAIAGRHSIDLGEDGDEDYGPYIDVLTLDASLAVSTTQVFTFDSTANGYWSFGEALATSGGTIAVGVPTAKVNGRSSAGLVRIYTADSADPTHVVLRKVLTQNSARVPGAAEEYDHFGSSLAMLNGRLAIGVPGETVGRDDSTGLVQPLVWHEATRTYTAHRAITQDTAGVPGSNEDGDRFGLDLAMGRGLTARGSYDIVIGADESVGRAEQAGSVTVANLTRSLYRGYTQESSGMPGNSQRRDGFYRVGVLRSSSGADTVLIGAPGEDTNGVENLGRIVRSNGTRLTSKTTWANVPIPAGAPGGLQMWGFSVGANG